jgi:MOSC domain-containing protein YiiM
MCASTLKNLEIEPGVLRENVVIKLDSLHDLPSGSVLRIGEVRVRLTFHCEPCGRIPSSIPRKAILHRRGVLCAILEGGTIRVGDRVALTGEKCDNIPYDIIDRLAWYIDRVDECVNVMTLLNDIGLSPSYARAMPSYLKRLPPRYRERVVFNGAAKRVSERQQR